MNVKQSETSHYGPGIRITKGERIVQSLHALQSKIREMEQKDFRELQDGKTSCDKCPSSDLTISDVQAKLLKLQMKYIRNILKTKVNSNGDASTGSTSSMSVATCCAHTHVTMAPTMLDNCNKETQTSKLSLASTKMVSDDDVGLKSIKSVMSSEEKCFNKNQPSKSQKKSSSEPDVNDAPEHNRTNESKAKSHYHLKLSDVPFIIGTSTGASHSVIANVQNIIGVMKTHNKGLCSPLNADERKGLCNTMKQNSIQDVSLKSLKKALKYLSGELSVLTVKQDNLKQRLSFSMHQKMNDSVHKEYMDVSKLIEAKAKEISDFHLVIQKASHKNSSASKRPNVPSQLHPEPKKPNVRNIGTTTKCQSNVLAPSKTHMAVPIEKCGKKHKVMHSLKQCRLTLQKDDIVWT